MSPLITRLVQQFRSKSQYDHFIREYQQKFDINPYRFQHMTPSMIKKTYNQLQQKQFCVIKKGTNNISYMNHDQTGTKISERHIENANWNQIAKEIYFRTNGQSYKSSKQCRQRWQNHLDNKIRKQGWEIGEDLAILEFVLENGKRWSKIVEKLQNTRTQHMVKNRFKSLLAKGEGRNKKQDGKKINGQGQAQETQLIQHIIKGLKQNISLSSSSTRRRHQQILQQHNQQQRQQRQQQYQQKQPTIESLQMQLQMIDKENKEKQQQQQEQQQEQQQQDVNTNIKQQQQQQKRSHGMMVFRGDSVEFVNGNNYSNNNNSNNNNEQISIFIQSQSLQPQPPYTFNIFQCPSPATLSLASSGFLLSSSYSSFTPPSITMGNNRNNLSFSSFHQHWERNNNITNRLQQKGSISSDVGSNNTSRLIECSRREDNLLFSLEFNNLLNSNNNNNLLNNNNNINNLFNNNININNNSTNYEPN